MHVQILSDLHLEFGSHHILNQIKQCNSDVLVVAGDLHTSKGIVSALVDLYTAVQKHIVFVVGNHEYYYSTKQHVDEMLFNRFNEHKYIHILNNDVWEYNNTVFVGSTGWWTMTEAKNVVHRMSDFTLIHDLIPSNYGLDWGKESEIFFNKTLRKYDKRVTGKNVVCVSHNAPSTRSIDDEFKGDQLNPCFVNAWEYIMLHYKPVIWAHGHTHGSKDYKIDDTRVICNPHGYMGNVINNQFDPHKIVSL